MIVVCERHFTAGKTYSDWFFAGLFKVSSISGDETDETSIYRGEKIFVNGHFKYMRRDGRYRIEIIEGKPYKGRPNWVAVTCAEAPRNCSEMKRYLHRAGTSVVEDADVDALWDEFGRNWYTALKAKPKTKRHARLMQVLGDDAVGKLVVLLEHFCASSWALRLRQSFPSMSDGVSKSLSRVLDKAEDDAEVFESWLNNPWEMAKYVSGKVSWRIVDTVALRDCGCDADDEARVEAACAYFVRDAMGGVDTCYRLSKFRCKAVYDGYLEYPDVTRHTLIPAPEMRMLRDGSAVYDESKCSPYFESGIKAALKHGLLHKDFIDGVMYVTDKKSYDSEIDIAERLASTKSDPRFDEDEAERILDEYCDKYDRRLDFSQREAVIAALSSTNAFVCGRPGYGKSAVIDAICYCFRRQLNAKKPSFVTVRIAALSGMAGQRLRNESIVGPNCTLDVTHPGYDDEDVMTVAKMLRFGDFLREVGLVIVDEASMCSVSDIGNICKYAGRNTHLVFVGDDAQLCPIGPGSPFESVVKANEGFPFPVVTLAVNHRLANSIGAEGLGEAFDAVRMSDIGVWRKRCEDGSIHVTNVLSVGEHVSEHIVDTYVERLSVCHGRYEDVVMLTPMHAGYMGRLLLSMLARERLCPRSTKKINFDAMCYSDFVCYERGVELRASGMEKDDPCMRKDSMYETIRCLGLPLCMNHSAGRDVPYDSPKNWCVGFRIGDRVLCNNTDDVKYNGDTGTIVEFSCEAGQVYSQGLVTIALDRGIEIKVTLGTLSSDFDLGYASTVHKSQGCEYMDVIACFGSMNTFAERPFITNKMLYTALTRTKRRVDVFSEAGVVDKLVSMGNIPRDTLLVERIQELR